MASSFFLRRLLRRMTAVPRPRVRSAMMVTMMPINAPMDSVTAPFVFEDVELEVTGTGTPDPDPVVVAAAALILLVNVLAYVVVSVVVSWLAVRVAVYEDVKTEYTFGSTVGGGV